jgi:hypothetical protein
MMTFVTAERFISMMPRGMHGGTWAYYFPFYFANMCAVSLVEKLLRRFSARLLDLLMQVSISLDEDGSNIL